MKSHLGMVQHRSKGSYFLAHIYEVMQFSPVCNWLFFLAWIQDLVWTSKTKNSQYFPVKLQSKFISTFFAISLLQENVMVTYTAYTRHSKQMWDDRHEPRSMGKLYDIYYILTKTQLSFLAEICYFTGLTWKLDSVVLPLISSHLLHWNERFNSKCAPTSLYSLHLGWKLIFSDVHIHLLHMGSTRSTLTFLLVRQSCLSNFVHTQKIIFYLHRSPMFTHYQIFH